MCAFFIATAQGVSATPNWEQWEVVVQRCSGFNGHLGLVIQHPIDKNAVIKGYVRMKPTKKDKIDGYGDSRRKHLTMVADDALAQDRGKALSCSDYYNPMSPSSASTA
jgi:hypothetical protein